MPSRYEPGHPDADAEGYVTYPNVNPVMEMADLLSAVRAYQLNAAAVQAAKSMIQQSLQILSSRADSEVAVIAGSIVRNALRGPMGMQAEMDPSTARDRLDDHAPLRMTSDKKDDV